MFPTCIDIDYSCSCQPLQPSAIGLFCMFKATFGSLAGKSISIFIPIPGHMKRRTFSADGQSWRCLLGHATAVETRREKKTHLMWEIEFTTHAFHNSETMWSSALQQIVHNEPRNKISNIVVPKIAAANTNFCEIQFLISHFYICLLTFEIWCLE